ncbi:MAG: polysaccharide deacetylase family protein [Spirochaetales bacterium]|nr:polysaccharide deacetylase family protein [Spirochaetales bacterium]
MGKGFFLLPLFLLGALLYGDSPDNSLLYNGQNQWDEQGPAVIYHGRRDSKKIALTIDDGWVPDYELLDFLEEQGVRCTVFIPGKIVASRPEWIRRMKEMGFEICCHGYSHKLLPFLSEEEQIREVRDTEVLLRELTGETPPLMRPSGGRLDGPYPTLPVMRDLGYTVILWDNDLRGYGKKDTVESQLDWLWEHLQPGNIILSHFGDALNTREVLIRWIPQVRERGYEFVLVSELLSDMEP